MRKVLLVFPVRLILLFLIKTDFTSPVKQSHFITIRAGFFIPSEAIFILLRGGGGVVGVGGVRDYTV